MERLLVYPPKRTFLDSSVLQLIHDHGEFIWDWMPIPTDAPIRARAEGVKTVDALRKIFSVTQRAPDWEFIVSDVSQEEVDARKNSAYSSWVSEVRANSDYLLEIEQKTYPTRRHADLVLEWKHIGYLGEGDRRLIVDALRFGCDAFLTEDRRLARNSLHIKKQLGLEIVSSEEYWTRLSPWAALFA